MSLEKVVKAMKMESVPPGWHAIITALLAVFIYEPQPLVSLLVEGSLLCRNAAALLRSPSLRPRSTFISAFCFLFFLRLSFKARRFLLLPPREKKPQQMAAATVCVFIISSAAI